MRDQYSFLKAIDTSSSSPELLHEEGAEEDEEAITRRQQALSPRVLKERISQANTNSLNTNSLTNGQTTASSSSINTRPKLNESTTTGGGGGGGGLRSKIQNLVKPMKFHQQAQQQAAAAKSLVIKRRESDARENDLRDRLLSTSNKSNGDSSKRRQVMAMLLSGQQQQQQQKENKAKQNQSYHSTGLAPNLNYFMTATGTVRTRPQNATMASNPHRRNHPTTSNAASSATNATTSRSNSNYLPSETQTAAAAAGKRHEPELVRCYEEIDQIYDYIRGLAPLPVNLRKIKSIDFEQLERERLKLAEKQQQQLQQLQQQQQQQHHHHQHRQRYIRSIGVDSGTSNGSASSSSGQPAAARRLVKARQRNVADLLHGDKDAPRPPSSTTRLAACPVSRNVAPMPIRVTTRSAESFKPSIKRVESLNLGQLKANSRVESETAAAASSGSATVAAKLISTKFRDGPNQALATTKPSYLISTTQRGQIFRLPRAHSTSTLNKPSLLSDRGTATTTGGRRASQAIAAKEPVIEENFPLVRLSSRPAPQTGSLGRSATSHGAGARYKERFSFESDLVESFVDDDDHEENTDDGPASRETMSSGRNERVAGRENSASFGSSAPSSRADEREQSAIDSSSSSSSASSSASSPSSSATSERLSQKSHSDYDNDSDANSESTNTVTSDTTTTTDTSNNKEEEDQESRSAEGASEGVAARSSKRDLREDAQNTTTLSSMSPFSAGSTGTGKSRSQRPTTSSSPSSGRPASPADETSDSDGEQETASTDMLVVTAPTGLSPRRHQLISRSSPLTRRRQILPRAHTPREEHIYEQIPPQRSHELQHKQQQQQQQLVVPSSRRMSSSNDDRPTRKILAGGAQAARERAPEATIKHPVAYATNVAVNRRYQQQVAALFALQQQRDRALSRRQSHMEGPASPPEAVSQMYQGHQRRASASNAQFVPQWRQATSTRQPNHSRRHLADMPHRHRLSMGNIHLLASALPLASLYPFPKQGTREDKPTRETKERRSSQNTNSLDDHEACSTGTTNSTSSYEAAIKNSEPNPLEIDLQQQQQQREEADFVHASGRRSVGSASGSRSLTNHLQLHSTYSRQHSPQQQQTSSLVKVPKLSKQSHLLQRPLPKPPNHRSIASTKHPVKVSPGNRLLRTTILDVFNQ